MIPYQKKQQLPAFPQSSSCCPYCAWSLWIDLPGVITFAEETKTSQAPLLPVLIASRPISKIRLHTILYRNCNCKVNYSINLEKRWLAYQNTSEKLRVLFSIWAKTWKMYMWSDAEGVGWGKEENGVYQSGFWEV